MVEMLSVLGLGLAFIGYGLLARRAESRGCGGCQRGEYDNGVGE